MDIGAIISENKKRIQLGDIIGGKALTKYCRIAHGGIAFNVNALLDSGAGGEAFVHHRLFPFIKTRFKPKLYHIGGGGVSVAGHNNKQTDTIYRLFQASLLIDGRRVPTTFLFCDTGKHDMLIGRQWFEKTRSLIDCYSRGLAWRDEDNKAYIFDVKKDIVLPRQEMHPRPVNPEHQADVERRDGLLAAPTQVVKQGVDPKRVRKLFCVNSKNGSSSDNGGAVPVGNGRTSWSRDQRDNLRKMQAQLYPKPQLPSPPRKIKTKCPTPAQLRKAGIDLSFVNALGFGLNAKRKDVVIGAISLHEVDKLIQDRVEEEDDPLANDEDELRRIIEEKLPDVYAAYTDVFSKHASDTLAPHRKGVDHDIVLEGDDQRLAPSPLYNMSLEQLELVKAYLEEHLRKGFIVPSDAPWASPVLFAKKPGGGWRFCVDFRKLNAITKKDRYPLPLVEETLQRLARAKIFTRLDVRQAFYRIRLKESAEDLTTFRTRYGSYKYKVLPFGLCNGPASFQRYINNILFDCLDTFCTAYMDDILIYSEDPLEHEAHVKTVLQRLRDAGLQADIKKSEFHVTKTKFLGYIISTDGIAMDPEKVAIIRDWVPPTSVKGVQSFLGFCNFYRSFLKNYGQIVRPLQRLTQKGGWHPLGPEEIEAFEKAKALVLTGGALVHYSPYRETRTETDASDGVIAGVLTQLQDDGTWRPVGYYSKALDTQQMRYEIHDKEMLAVMRGLREWRGLLIGLQKTPFTAVTDHRALEYFTTKKLLNQRQARWAEELADYNLRITYRPGLSNTIADILSRKHDELKTQKAKDIASRNQVLIDPTIVVAALEQSTKKPPVLAETPIADRDAPAYELIDKILHANRVHDSLEVFRKLATTGKEGWKLADGLLTYHGKLVVPDTDLLRTQLVQQAHCTRITAHPGKTKTRKLVSEQYYWPGLGAFVDRFVAACRDCRWSTVWRDKTPGLLHPLPVGERCWQHVSFDFKSFPMSRKGHDNAFVTVDRLGKRSFSLPCHKTATAADAARLYYQHIWRIYGTPETATSDRGPQFISAFTDELCKLTGVKQKLSTAYHPQTDGGTEVLNQYIDQRLRPFVNHHQDDWDDLLPAMDFAQAILPHESTGLSPFELEFGYKPRLHFDWQERTRQSPTPREQLSREEAQAFAQRAHGAVQWARENLFKAQKRQSEQANRHRREPDFGVGDWVYVSRKGWTTDRPSVKLDRQNAGPYQIIAMKGHSYELQLPNHMKMSNVFHADRLRKAKAPVPGQEQKPEAPVEINGQPEWEVAQVLASRIQYRRLQYKVSWVGEDPDENYYNANNFIGAPHKIKQFHDEHPEAAGPPVRLQTWLEAYLKGVILEPTPEDDKALQKAVKEVRRRRKKS